MYNSHIYVYLHEVDFFNYFSENFQCDIYLNIFNDGIMLNTTVT